MEPLISVIIPEFTDGTYFIRCSNSVKRQIHKNIELIVVNSRINGRIKENGQKALSGDCWDHLQEAVMEAKGKYLFFCSVTSILAPNVLSGLLQEMENGRYICASCMIPDGEDFRECPQSGISIYGRLFESEKIRENHITFMSGSQYPEAEFILEYLSLYGEIQIGHSINIYETDKDVFLKRDGREMESGYVNKIIELTKNICFPYKQDFVVQLLGTAFPEKDRSANELMQCLLSVADTMLWERELNYQLSRGYVKGYYHTAITEKDDVLYGLIRRYFGIFETEEDYLKVMLDASGISIEQYEVMRKYELEDYLFYRGKLPDRDKMIYCVDEIESMKRLLKAFEDRIIDLENGIGKQMISPEPVQQTGAKESNGMELEGPMLAEWVVQKYKEGKLGLKTIFKSMKAWSKYKF